MSMPDGLDQEEVKSTPPRANTGKRRNRIHPSLRRRIMSLSSVDDQEQEYLFQEDDERSKRSELMARDDSVCSGLASKIGDSIYV